MIKEKIKFANTAGNLWEKIVRLGISATF